MRALHKLVLFLVLAAAPAAHACPICLDTSSAGPESSQRALRRSIAVLLAPTLFFMGLVGVVVYRHHAPGDND
ncbi:MAG: hypothetical protein HYX26_06950 [Acidobacteriales bacterium]|nr:hypothetical protein [Terriglobales bacterium]